MTRLRIAVAQTRGAELSAWRETLASIEAQVRTAAANRADLVLLPECAWPAYNFASREAYAASRAAGMPGDNHFLDHMARLARELRLLMCTGYVAEHGGRLWNRAALIGRDGGLLGTQDKCFLWDRDHDLYECAARIQPIETPIGPIGVLICADNRVPEIPATLVARGARLLLQPTAWVNVSGSDDLWNPQPAFLVPARAMEFGVPFASASKCGVEHGTRFVGCSLVCDAAGRVLAQCGAREPQIAFADVEIPDRARLPQFSDTQRAALRDGAAGRGAAAPNSLRLQIGQESVAKSEAERVDERLGPLTEGTLGLSVGSGGERDVAAPDASVLRIAGPLADVVAQGRALIAAIDAGQANEFAPLRVFALRGVHVVVLFGAWTTGATVRTRAAENRIFVIWARPDAVEVIDPRGQLIAALRGWPTCSVELQLSLSLAADKQVAPRTHVFAAREPSQYEL